jgi:hypothetical protein|tara:strand:+ start:531 stop:1127 length:597 start_codon:yes stop_codon:yes gene_type:complete
MLHMALLIFTRAPPDGACAYWAARLAAALVPADSFERGKAYWPLRKPDSVLKTALCKSMRADRQYVVNFTIEQRELMRDEPSLTERVRGRRVFSATKASWHAQDKVWAEDPQLRALAERHSIDIVSINSQLLADKVNYYEVGSSVICVPKSWRAYVVPRLLRQRNRALAKRERQLLVLIYNGVNHFDAALPMSAGAIS